jgi:hypothetical protein
VAQAGGLRSRDLRVDPEDSDAAAQADQQDRRGGGERTGYTGMLVFVCMYKWMYICIIVVSYSVIRTPEVEEKGLVIEIRGVVCATFSPNWCGLDRLKFSHLTKLFLIFLLYLLFLYIVYTFYYS